VVCVRFTCNDTYRRIPAYISADCLCRSRRSTESDSTDSRHGEVVSSVRRSVNSSVSFLCRSVIDFRTCPRPSVSRRRNSCRSVRRICVTVTQNTARCASHFARFLQRGILMSRRAADGDSAIVPFSVIYRSAKRPRPSSPPPFLVIRTCCGQK